MFRSAQRHFGLSRRVRRLVKASIESAASLTNGPALAEMLEGRVLLSGSTFTVKIPQIYEPALLQPVSTSTARPKPSDHSFAFPPYPLLYCS